MQLIRFVLITICSAIWMGSCAAQSTENVSQNQKSDIMNTEGKKLVAFFSHTGENYNVGYIDKGNTHIVESR